MSTDQQNPRAAALLSESESEAALPPSQHGTATTIEPPPYVRIEVRFYTFQTVPTRLQDTVSLSEWRSLGCQVQPILRKNDQFDTFLTLLDFLCWMVCVAILAWNPGAIVVTGTNDNWRSFAITMGTIVLLLIGFQCLQNCVQNWQQRALQTVCRAAQEATFQSLGWALDGRYHGTVECRQRAPSVIYFNPLPVQSDGHGNRWDQTGDVAIYSPTMI
jgi:hypothetical protein